MSDPMQGFGKFVPGFDFLQGLVKNAGASMPFSQWVAPTLDPKELEKRIDELRTVQFWLEQNARMLATTIQALEVQRMTLSTLQTMNVSADALREALQVRMPEPRAEQPRATQARAEREPEPEPEEEAPRAGKQAAAGEAASTSAGNGSGARRRGPDAMVGRADQAVRGPGHRDHERGAQGNRHRHGSCAQHGCRHGQVLNRCHR